MSKPDQLPLFPEIELPPPSNIIEVLVREKPSGKVQTAFKRLVEKIASTRDILKDWCAYEERYRQRLVNELHPLLGQLQAGRRELVFLIDTLLSSAPIGRRKTFSKTDKQKLLHIMLTLTNTLLEHKPEDSEIECIHDKYADVSYAESQKLALEMEKSMLEQMFGMDLSDYDPSQSEDILAFAQSKFEQKLQADGEFRKTTKPKKAAKNGPSQQEQAAKEASLSVRTVYRKLASALHPDRETDPAERERKTTLMQRVNCAYKANDLLTLLNLQLEIEQIDAEHILTLPEPQLKHYMRILRSQLKELEDEIVGIAQHFPGWEDGLAVSPERIDGLLSREITENNTMIRTMQNDLALFRDPLQLRSWLEKFVIPREKDLF